MDNEVEMKRKELEKGINKALKRMGLDDAIKIVVAVEGTDIEADMRLRGYRPVGESEEEGNAKHKALVDRQRLEACEIIKRRIEAAKALVAAWTEMLESIQTPLDERKPDQLEREVALAEKINELYKV